jgi:hypothetical protein
MDGGVDSPWVLLQGECMPDSQCMLVAVLRLSMFLGCALDSGLCRSESNRMDAHGIWVVRTDGTGQQQHGIGRILTDAEDDDEDDEGVHHREEGGGDRRHHLLERVDPPEEPDDAQGAHELDEPVGDVERPQIDEGHEDDEYVEVVPAAVHEWGEPVGVGVDAELHGEVGGEGEVQVAHDVAELGR